MKHKISKISLALALVFLISPAVQASTLEKPEKLKNKNTLHLKANQRPVYIGIHGGTAPVSLLRAPNGMLLAFTGQTGNDFILSLQNNASQHNKTMGSDSSPKKITFRNKAGKKLELKANKAQKISAQLAQAQESEKSKSPKEIIARSKNASKESLNSTLEENSKSAKDTEALSLAEKGKNATQKDFLASLENQDRPSGHPSSPARKNLQNGTKSDSQGSSQDGSHGTQDSPQDKYGQENIPEDLKSSQEKLTATVAHKDFEEKTKTSAVPLTKEMEDKGKGKDQEKNIGSNIAEADKNLDKTKDLPKALAENSAKVLPKISPEALPEALPKSLPETKENSESKKAENTVKATATNQKNNEEEKALAQAKNKNTEENSSEKESEENELNIAENTAKPRLEGDSALPSDKQIAAVNYSTIVFAQEAGYAYSTDYPLQPFGFSDMDKPLPSEEEKIVVLPAFKTLVLLDYRKIL